ILIAGLAGASVPSFAAPRPEPPQHAMDCDSHHPAPKPHLPAGCCCLANICAMNLALLTLPSGLMEPIVAKMPAYDLRALRQPPGMVTAPIPHPPKSQA